MLPKGLKPDWFLIAMAGVIFLAWLFPEPGAEGGFLHPEILTKAGVALIFFLHGVLLSFDALRDGVLRWRLHLIVQLSTYLFFPLLAIGLIFLLRPWLTPELQLGILYLGALPSTVSSSVAMTAAARGNVPVAVFNATLSGMIGIFLTPLWMSLLLEHTGTDLPLGKVIFDLICWMMLPLFLGQCVRPLIGHWMTRHKRYVSKVDRGTILLLVYTSFCDSFHYNVWTGHGLATLLLAAGCALACFTIVLTTLWMLCNRWGIAPANRAAVVFCGTKKSMATGVPMARLIFGATPELSLILLPIMLYHPIQLLICTTLASRWARQSAEG